MTDFRALAAAYLRQRIDVGEDVMFLSGKAPRAGAVRTNFGPTPPSAPVLGDLTESEIPRSWLEGAPEIPGPGTMVEHVDLIGKLKPEFETLGMPEIVRTIAACTECTLCEERTHTVPGVGDPAADFMVVGEGPGQNEDQQGEPFVGRAGKLLDDIIGAIGLSRREIFIANIVKCRPPGNRNPQPDEIASCIPFLYRQIELVDPKVILAVGSVAACALLGSKKSLGQMRNKVHRFRGIPLVVTYHPAALLRNPNWKRPTWDDVRIARRILDSRS